MRSVLLAGLLAVSMASPAVSATILSFVSTAGTQLSPAEQAAGVTATGLTRGPGLLAATGATFNSRNWTLGGTAATARSNNDYLDFSLSSSVAYDLTSLDIRYDRSNTGPFSIAIDLIVNSVSYLNYFTDPSVSTAGEVASINLSGFTAVTSLTFRLLGFGATNLAGTFDLENMTNGRALVLSGTPTLVPATVPLPPSLALLALGLFLLPRRRAPKLG